MVQVHEVNERIIKEIKEYDTDAEIKQFLLDVLDFELEHIDERVNKRKVHFRDDYEHMINKCCRDSGE
jgi:hypothetical protein